MVMRSSKPELSCAQAKKKWGDKIYARQPDGSTALTEVEDDGGTWRPVYDAARNWAGYRFSNSPNYARKRQRRRPAS